MRFVIYLLITLVSVMSVRAAVSIEGNIKLVYSDSPFAENVFRREFGDVVKATCKWYAGEFFDKETVFAGITVKNTGTQPMSFQYYVAFFDKEKKLLGAAGQSSFGKEGLAVGEETFLGSCLVHLPKDKYKEIDSYQAIIYETPVASKE